MLPKVLQNDTRFIHFKYSRYCVIYMDIVMFQQWCCKKIRACIMKIIKTISMALIIIANACLTGCYVVPLDQYQPHTNSTTIPVAVTTASSVVLNARLYPINQYAAPFGVLNASITNHLNGRGEVMVMQGDELFRGEATRDPNNSRGGTANGTGNKGGFMNCSYAMNSHTQGTGTCSFQNNAMYRFHIGD
jgi:hypothetical protein